MGELEAGGGDDVMYIKEFKLALSVAINVAGGEENKTNKKHYFSKS